MRRILERIYARKLVREIKSRRVPAHVVIIMDGNESLRKIEDISKWAREVGVEEITFYSESIFNADEIFDALKKEFRVEIVTRESKKIEGSGKTKIRLFMGIRGREELVTAVREMARDALLGKIKPEDVSEELIKKYLFFEKEPDLIIRTGGSALADALIWQGVYSELYFTEAGWKEFREIDFLRAIRDYQKRERRFGK